MTDDRKSDPGSGDDLERYLKGGSKLSRAYRDASHEAVPPQLDDAVLALARSEVRRKAGLSKLLAPVALAASLILGVNLAWNVRNAEPAPKVEVAESSAPMAPAVAPINAPLQSAPPEVDADERKLEAAKARAKARAEQRLEKLRESLDDLRGKRYVKPLDSTSDLRETASAEASKAAAEPAPMAAIADAAPLTEAQKIDHLIAYVTQLQGAVFMRNGNEYGPDKAAEHLRLKRKKAGDRVKTADDFIRLCASHSYLSGEAYLIRFPDGRTRTAEDVLREELQRMGSEQ